MNLKCLTYEQYGIRIEKTSILQENNSAILYNDKKPIIYNLGIVIKLIMRHVYH